MSKIVRRFEEWNAGENVKSSMGFSQPKRLPEGPGHRSEMGTKSRLFLRRKGGLFLTFLFFFPVAS